MTESTNRDYQPTENQITNAEWFAHYIGEQLPKKARSSNNALWAWLNRSVRRIDREDARTAKIDHGIDVDYDSDPFEIIGALKYRTEARWKPPIEEAMEMILRGVHPYTAEDVLGLTEEEFAEAVRIVEAEGYEIDWGSV